MKMNKDDNWLMNKSAEEGNGLVSVGGLVSRS